MTIRPALREDVFAIVGLLADDLLGAQREDFKDPLPLSYYQAFDKISLDNNQELMVLEDEDGRVIGTFQLSFFQPVLRHHDRCDLHRAVQQDESAFHVLHNGRAVLQWFYHNSGDS